LIQQGKWIQCGNTPVDLVEDGSSEIGSAILPPDGRVFAIGATDATCLYTSPNCVNQPGSWTVGPMFPALEPGQQLGAKDAPACLLPDGSVMCVASPINSAGFDGPTYFFEFNPISETLSAGKILTTTKLLLPTGQVLFANELNQIEVYTSAGDPDPAWEQCTRNVETLCEGDLRTDCEDARSTGSHKLFLMMMMRRWKRTIR
jgi:hypothetical protein